jgi:hypothetical protein
VVIAMSDILERLIGKETLATMDREDRKIDYMLYKTKMREQERVEQEKKQQQRKPLMREYYDVVPPERRDNAWNAWADQRINDLLVEYDDKVVKKTHNRLVSDLEKEFDVAFEEIEKLRAEVATLRSELTAVRAIASGEIKLIPTKAKDNVA